MTDIELLEAAANAAGYDQEDLPNHDGPWNPLTDDGDEARLEAELGFDVHWGEVCVLVGPTVCSPETGSAYAEYFDKHGGDKQSARRRAGVLAAAEIGVNVMRLENKSASMQPLPSWLKIELGNEHPWIKTKTS